MENCSFCGYTIPPGTGKMYVQKDARILYFCSKRCEKNLLKLGRNPRTTTFTALAAKEKKKAPKAEKPETEPKPKAAPKAEKPKKAKTE